MTRRFHCVVGAMLLSGLLACELEPAVPATTRATAAASAEGDAPPATKPSAIAAPPATATSSVTAAPFGDACDAPALLALYHPVKRPSRDRIVLQLVADLHAVDCGAPDSYGHDIEATLHVEPRDEKCLLAAATVRYEPRGHLDAFAPPVAPEAVTKRFDLSTKIDLASPQTKEVVFRRDVALVLGADAFWFYHRVRAGDELCGLEREEPTSPRCRFGGTNATCSHGVAEWFATPELRRSTCGDRD